MADKWTASDVPRLDGKTYIVTGANSGIGFEASKVLAHAGAHVVFACRSEARAREAMAALEAAVPGAKATFIALDLASLASVRAFADAAAQLERVDALVNNAGLMGLPFGKTEDGFETTFGVNHLGHFALTGLLLPRLLASGTAAAPARIVTVSSIAHRSGSIRFDDLGWDRGYWSWGAYGMSKLANLLFAFELDRRLDAAGEPAMSLACHPGVSDTNLIIGTSSSRGLAFLNPIVAFGSSLVTQPAWKGALPTLWAATKPDAKRGSYVGPGGPLEAWGWPKEVGCTRAARDLDAARRLWEASEELTGVRYPLAAPVS